MNRFALLLSISIIIFLGSCEKEPSIKTIEPSGNVTKSTRLYVAFEELHCEGDFQIYYSKSNSGSIEILAHESFFPYIETTISNNKLTIKAQNGTVIAPSSKTPITIRISSPKLSSVSLIGKGFISIDALNGTTVKTMLNGTGSIACGSASATNLEVEHYGNGIQNIKGSFTNAKIITDGTGTVVASGTCKNLNIDSKTAGLINASALTSDISDIRIMGSTNCTVKVNSKLNVVINGSGSVSYSGNAVVTKSLIGTGTIKKL